MLDRVINNVQCFLSIERRLNSQDNKDNLIAFYSPGEVDFYTEVSIRRITPIQRVFLSHVITIIYWTNNF